MRLTELHELITAALKRHGDIAVGCWLTNSDGELHTEDEGSEITRDPDCQVRQWDRDGYILAHDEEAPGNNYMGHNLCGPHWAALSSADSHSEAEATLLSNLGLHRTPEGNVQRPEDTHDSDQENTARLHPCQ